MVGWRVYEGIKYNFFGVRKESRQQKTTTRDNNTTLFVEGKFVYLYYCRSCLFVYVFSWITATLYNISTAINRRFCDECEVLGFAITCITSKTAAT